MSTTAYEKIPPTRQPALRQNHTTISGVGGKSVDVAGSSEMTLAFDGIPIIHEIISWHCHECNSGTGYFAFSSV